jgi:hypothetical protein
MCEMISKEGAIHNEALPALRMTEMAGRGVVGMVEIKIR